MGRWQMCSRCGVKLIQSVFEEDVEILACPICKRGTLTVSGELLKEVRAMAKERGQTVKEVLEGMVKRLEKITIDIKKE